MKAVLISSNGTPPEEIEGAYEEIKKAIDGWLEIVPLIEAPFVMLCNEEGKLEDLPINPTASLLAFRYGQEELIVGNVVLVGLPDANCDHTEYSLTNYREL